MRNVYLLLSIGLFIGLFSCGSSSDAFTSQVVQKRKYTKGFHVNRSVAKASRNRLEVGHVSSEQSKGIFVLTKLDENRTVVKANSPLVASLNIDNIEAPSISGVDYKFERKVIEPVVSQINSDKIYRRTNKEIRENTIISKKKKASGFGTGETSQIIAAILCFLVGGIGIHRFYLGYTTIGILQIITLGGLGVWTLIDLIRIIVGNLKPKDGDYTTTFNDL